MRFARNAVLAVIVSISLSTGAAWADVVTLKNGDKLTGTVGEISGGKMKFASPVLGEIVIDLANVESFQTDAAVTLRPKQGEDIAGGKIEGTAEKVQTADGQSYVIGDLKSVNPPPQKWTGAILATAALARGNTDTFDVGIRAEAALRRDQPRYDDRLSLFGKYNYGTTGRGDDSSTNTDNWEASAKYDKFWTNKLYGYAQMKAEHDRIAALEYRLSPGVGLGYQWIEQPDMNFNTEVGLSYVYEQYDDGGGHSDYIAVRLAYHFDKSLTDSTKFIHNLEYLPAIDDPGDFNLNADAGIRTNLTQSLFTEFKVEYKYDATPAPDAMKNDVRYIVGVGWAF